MYQEVRHEEAPLDVGLKGAAADVPWNPLTDDPRHPHPRPALMSTSSSASDEPELINTLRSHKAPVNCLTFSPSNEQLVSGSDEGSLIFWNLNGDRPNETGLCYRLTGHKSAVNALDFASTGQFFVSASRDTTVRLWKLSSCLSKPNEEPVVYKCHGLVSI